MQIINGKLEKSDVNANARGGTELMSERLARSIDPELLKKFQIIVSRVKAPLDPTKIRILYCHDLPDDPESQHLAQGGWNRFHKIVFVSHSQMNAYVQKFGIPYSHCVVLHNAIEPIPHHEKPTDVINLAYWSTPHRGLHLLVPVFDRLATEYENIKLNVYSSFNLYGWESRDKDFEELFDLCRQHPHINYHGAISNEDLREQLKDQHILAFPSIWTETSCLVLMEAMSAGMFCVHSNLGALYETSANWTMMYQFDEDPNRHATTLYVHLKHAIEQFRDEDFQAQISSAKQYADIFYNWDTRAQQWTNLLESLTHLPTDLPEPAQIRRRRAPKDFTYRVGG